jgi:hypothetical protein
MVARLFFFNPTNEMAIANGQVSYMPPLQLQKFERDLASLPWLLGNEKDFILVRDLKGNSLEHIRDLGWKIPKIITDLQDIENKDRVNLMPDPWGWSPAVYRLFNNFQESTHPEWKNHPFFEWKKNHARLLSRETGYRLLNQLHQIKAKSPGDYDLIYFASMPLVVKDKGSLPQIMKSLDLPAVIKTPFSASGRGLFRIRDERDDPENSPWVHGMLKRQGCIYIEKMLRKIQDVSFQFVISKYEIKYLGHNFFYTDPSGQFAGCAIGWPRTGSPLFSDEQKVKAAIKQASELVFHGLKEMEINRLYAGTAGVDGIFFEDDQGNLKVQPCLEMNLRHNMGLANLLFKRKVHQNARGTWRTGTFKRNQWKTFCAEQIHAKPFIFQDGKLIKGFLPFVDPSGEKMFGAWLELE